MDIFYHWRDFALDMKEGRIGTLGSNGTLLEQLKERLPRKVWTFVTPKGKKDRLQLIGSFLITESKPVLFVPKWKYNLFYDAASPRSVLYTDSDSPEKIHEVSDYFNRRFNATGKSSLHGEKGILEMEADVVRGFEKLAQGRGPCLSVDLVDTYNLLEGSVRKTHRPQDDAVGCRPTQRSRRRVLRQPRCPALARADRSGHRILRQPPRTRACSPQTNGIVERLRKTMLNGFYRIAFRSKIYDSIPALDIDLDVWLDRYNNGRERQGRWCYGKMPMYTFLDSLELAKEN